MKIVKPSAKLLGLLLPVELDEDSVSEVTSYIPERIIEQAGRVCYKSEDKTTPTSYQTFVDKVCNQLHHESVMEHSGATILAVCDRGVSHEIVRHRIGSYSQESTRYCNYGKNKFDNEISVVCPPGLEPCSKHPYDPAHLDMSCPECAHNFVWVRAMNQAEDAYLTLLDKGFSPQIARSVLPTCLKTEIVITYNFREWKHFLKLRTAPAAHPQMRELALMIQDILVKVAPTIFSPVVGPDCQ